MAASPDPKELQEVKKLLEDIEKIYQKIGMSNPFSSKSAEDFVGKIDELKDGLEDANDILYNMDGGVNDLLKSWQAVVNEVKTNNSTINKSKSSLNSLTSIAQKLSDHQKGINELSSKDLSTLQKKFRSQKENLKLQQDSLQNLQIELQQKIKSGNFTQTEVNQLSQVDKLLSNINGLVEDKDSILKETGKKLQEEYDIQKKIENSMGIIGSVLKGISKIPILGDLIDSQSVLDDMSDSLREGNGILSSVGKGFKNLGSQLKSGILNPANLITLAFTETLKVLGSVDNQTGDMAKSMNMTYSEALNTRKELGNIATLSGDVALNTKGLQETYMAIGQSLGSNAMASEATLKTFTKLREQAGYTNEQLAELNKLSLVNGKSLEDNTKEILGGAQAYASRKGLVINEKQVLDDVVKASASLKLSLGGSADALAKSAVQARSVGLNLEQASAMADQLLQFESSIENELSAELLTGKDLNFERARTLALNNDIAGAAEEIAKQVGSSADFAKMNAIQQEAIAKAAGLTKDQLAQSLIDREALAKLSGVEGKDAKEKFDNLVKQVGMEEAKKRLGNEQLANQFEQQSVQERFNQSVEKLKEIFVNLAGPVLSIVSPIIDLLIPALSTITTLLTPVFDMFNGISKILTGSWDSLNGWEATMGGIAIVAASILAITKMEAMYNGFIQGYKIAQLALEKANKQGILGTIGALTVQLGIQLGLLSASLATNAAVTFGVGVAVAVAAAAAGYAAIKSLTGDDIMSPGDGSSGYGKRTLFGPEGAIQLNNKDTVIAGTDLFKKSDDMVSGPKGAITVANSTSPKKETPSNPNSETNALLAQMLKGQKEVNTIPTLRIQ